MGIQYRLKRNLLLLFLVFSTVLMACGQQASRSSVEGLSIDPSISKEAEKHISIPEDLEVYKGAGTGIQVYNNSAALQYYENDSLVSESDFGERQILFKSFYLWRNDTLHIDGAFGLFGGYGFDIKIVRNKAILYHMLSAGEYPAYAYGAKDSLRLRLEVPCTDTKIVLSELPDPAKKQVIYGYIEFKSADFYSSSGFVGEEEILPRKKMRTNMKLYFKSGHLNL